METSSTHKYIGKWNYRILAHEHKGEIYFLVHEVFFNKDGIPDRYSDNPSEIGGDSIDDICWTIDAIRDAALRPILWAGEKFPAPYIL
jgi:hypothetical protein